MLNLLKTEPEGVNRFSDVWLWSDWPGREGRRDTGVDLVAKHRDRDGYPAIQCTFYDPARRVPKGDLDTFLAASGMTFTSLRIAEQLVGAGGRVLFLVPSIQLLSQSLREWNAGGGGRPPPLLGLLGRAGRA